MKFPNRLILKSFSFFDIKRCPRIFRLHIISLTLPNTQYWDYRRNIISIFKICWWIKEAENLSWILLINNNYVNSRIQTRSESSMNLFSSNPSSFEAWVKNIKKFSLEWVRVRREWIHTWFWSSLNPGINVIIIN